MNFEKCWKCGVEVVFDTDICPNCKVSRRNAPPQVFQGQRAAGSTIPSNEASIESVSFQAKRGSIVWRMVLCVFLVPFGFFVYLLFGLAGVAGALISAGALTGLIQGGYRLLCRVEVSSRLLKKAAPWGGWETPLDRIEHWSIRRGADHGKSVLNRNPVSLRNDETVEIHLSDQVKPRLLHDFEVSEPGWDQFLGTLRRHIEGKENQFLSSTKGS